ncbi:ribosome hibernation-promoting factor, HPF/YfiA family [Bacteroidota bacterium]
MTTDVTFRHFSAVPNLRDHAENGVNKLSKFYDGITAAHVVLDVEQFDTTMKTAEISLAVYRQTLTASETAGTHEEAINGCVAHLRRQILKYKGRLRAIDKDVHH